MMNRTARDEMLRQAHLRNHLYLLPIRQSRQSLRQFCRIQRVNPAPFGR